ncbi:MAG: NAD(P)-dependent oxidoreductase [Gammaproteobacteria bacterium]|nr:NAD(P)-dependent oxidoreductase [Gammaproteobacteria bacterium]
MAADQPARVAFIGLGVMGFPMAGHLSRVGHDVVVYNRTATKMDIWLADFTGRGAPTPTEAARDRDIVFACVGNDDDVREIATGKYGAFHGMSAGAVFVDHTTTSAKLAQELAGAATERGFGFLDAPVSGGEAGAQNGTLTVMTGGEQAVFDRCRAVMGAYASTVTLMGPAGAGQLTKMVNQVCIAGVLQGLSEGLDLALRTGLDADQVLDVISKGAAQSWQMDNRGQTMIRDEFDFGFAVDWMRKDLDICLAQAHEAGALLPLTALVNEFYARLQARGGGRWDTSSLIRLLREP